MYKVNKEDFIRLPAETLCNQVRASDNFCLELMIKTDTSEEYENKNKSEDTFEDLIEKVKKHVYEETNISSLLLTK